MFALLVTQVFFKQQLIRKKLRALLGALATRENTKAPPDLSLLTENAARVKLDSFKRMMGS